MNISTAFPITSSCISQNNFAQEVNVNNDNASKSHFSNISNIYNGKQIKPARIENQINFLDLPEDIVKHIFNIILANTTSHYSIFYQLSWTCKQFQSICTLPLAEIRKGVEDKAQEIVNFLIPHLSRILSLGVIRQSERILIKMGIDQDHEIIKIIGPINEFNWLKDVKAFRTVLQPDKRSFEAEYIVPLPQGTASMNFYLNLKWYIKHEPDGPFKIYKIDKNASLIQKEIMKTTIQSLNKRGIDIFNNKLKLLFNSNKFKKQNILKLNTEDKHYNIRISQCWSFPAWFTFFLKGDIAHKHLQPPKEFIIDG